jgi:hypothetical protein
LQQWLHQSHSYSPPCDGTQGTRLSNPFRSAEMSLPNVAVKPGKPLEISGLERIGGWVVSPRGGNPQMP